AGDFGEFIGNAKFAPLGVALGFLLLEIFASAALDLFGGILVEAFDVRDFREIDVSDFFDRREAFGNEKLRDDLVDIERIHEKLSTLGKFLLATLAFFLLR